MDQTNQTNETDQITQLGSNVPHYSWEKSILTNRLPMCTFWYTIKVQYKKGREIANGKNGNDTRKTYAGNKRKG